MRKSGNRVRINVQLINAVNDEHIWSDVYDRDLTDVFAIQTDLAKRIADELHAKLSPTEKEQLARKPTENSEAYLAFVQAHNLHRDLEDRSTLKQAEDFYQRALELDPNFALACASLSRLDSWIYHTYEPTPERRQKARALAERSLQLQPGLPEGHLALGFSIYYGERGFDRALEEFAIAQKGLPNDSEVYLAIGAIQRRQGKWQESNANLEKAASLSPNETWPLQNLALNYQMERDFDAAYRTMDRALKLSPNSLNLWTVRAQIEISDKGSFETADRAIEALGQRAMGESDKVHFTVSIAQMRLVQRRYAEALSMAAGIRDEALGSDSEGLSGKYGTMGVAKKALGDSAGAQADLLKARTYAEQFVAAGPDEGKRHGRLAEVLAWLGEKDAAIAEAKRGMELLPESIDAFDGPVCTQTLCEVYLIVGEYDKALEILDGLLTRPTQVTVSTVKVSPLWDPIRQDPRFVAMLKKHGG